MEKRTISLRVSAATFQSIRQEAARKRQTMQDLLASWLKKHFDRLTPLQSRRDDSG